MHCQCGVSLRVLVMGFRAEREAGIESGVV